VIDRPVFAVLGDVFTYFFVVRAKSIHWLNVLDIMSGEDAVSRRSNYFVGGSIPWSGMLYSLGALLVLYLCALLISRHHDF
jgi:hypothetical protein